MTIGPPAGSDAGPDALPDAEPDCSGALLADPLPAEALAAEDALFEDVEPEPAPELDPADVEDTLLPPVDALPDDNGLELLPHAASTILPASATATAARRLLITEILPAC